MEYENIRKIWMNYIQSEEYQAVRENNEFDYSIDKSDEERLESALGRKQYMDVESVAMALACQAEEIGFIQGFIMGTQLMSECFSGRKGEKNNE